MSDTYNIQKFLGKKGFSGSIFQTDPATGSVAFDPDDNVTPLVYRKGNGSAITGFYSVRANIDDVEFSAKITISGYMSKKDFLRNPGRKAIQIIYFINNSDQVLNGDGTIATPGTFDTYFSKDVVKTSGNCEQWKAIDLVLALNGTKDFQASFPVNFTSGFSTSSITQSNIDSVNAE